MVNKEDEEHIIPLQLSLKYLLSHHHQTTGMSVSDRLLGEQHGPWYPSVHSTQMSATRLLQSKPPPESPQGKNKHAIP